MTECTTDGAAFSSLDQRKIQVDFNGGQLITDSGVLLLREVDRRIGLSERIAACIPDPRETSKIQHDQQTMIRQRMMAIACGYEDLNDHDQLRHDTAMQIAVERTPGEDAALASAPTLCRLENRIDRTALARINALFVEQFLASHEHAPEQIILDFDATDDLLHGQQEGRFFHGYYDHYCYLPLYVFCDHELLCAYLRPSNIDAAKHSRAILKLLVDRIRQDWPETRIIMRADSGFCRWRLMRWCDRHEVGYILGLARNKVLERISEDFAEAAEAAYRRTGQKQRHFHVIEYAAGTWDRSRPVIVKAEHLSEGRNLRFVVTNLMTAATADPRALYDRMYCQRGEMENRIKEQQLMLFADRTSCHRLLSNQFRLLLSSAAYVLMQTLRRTALASTTMARAQVDTIRLKLIKIAARVKVSVRRVVVSLASNHPSRALFAHVAAQLVGPAAAPG